MSELITVVIDSEKKKLDIKTDIKDYTRVTTYLFSAGLGALEKTGANRKFSTQLLEEILKDFFDMKEKGRVYHASNFYRPN